MKILVFSDSHAGLSFMRFAVKAVRPDAIVHLGDFLEDALALGEDFPHIPLHAVPGNCDRYLSVRYYPELLCYDVCGVRLFMTHGHNQKVKQGLWTLMAEARKLGAAAALYGHTHRADCHQEDGLWVLNPGACGTFGGSVGLIETMQGSITSCRILTYDDLDKLL